VFQPLPATAAWLHRHARSGFEVVFLQAEDGRPRVEGRTAAIEDGLTWVVDYEIILDDGWVTRSATVAVRTAAGVRSVRLEADGRGHWRLDGQPAPELTGCLDLDLESSAFTNALPVHRMRLAVGDRADVPAAYVRATDLRVERLEQAYVRAADRGGHQRYGYTAPVFSFACELVYDGSGLLLDYPGIAVRAG
jgi:hypothetical protein